MEVYNARRRVIEPTASYDIEAPPLSFTGCSLICRSSAPVPGQQLSAEVTRTLISFLRASLSLARFISHRLNIAISISK